jgi:hypothetical protein
MTIRCSGVVARKSWCKSFTSSGRLDFKTLNILESMLGIFRAVEERLMYLPIASVKTGTDEHGNREGF